MVRVAQCFAALLDIPDPLHLGVLLEPKFERVQKKRFNLNFGRFIVDVRGFLHRK